MSGLSGGDGGQVLAIYVFFLVLCTTAVGLRLFTRVRLSNSVLGLDDAVLTICYIGFVLIVAFALRAVDLGLLQEDLQPRFNLSRASFYNSVRNILCFAVSGLVRISVALCIYRLLEHRPVLKAIVITDIVLCAITTIVCNLVLDLGCVQIGGLSPYAFDPKTCEVAIFAQEGFFILFSLFNALFPTWLLWNTRLRRSQKISVMIIFSLGLLSTMAVSVKLRSIVLYLRAGPSGKWHGQWNDVVKWGAAEHGLSIFAAAIIALRPFLDRVATHFTNASRSMSQHYPRHGSIASRLRRNKDGSTDSHSQLSDQASHLSRTGKRCSSCCQSRALSHSEPPPPPPMPKLNLDALNDGDDGGLDPTLPPAVVLTPVAEKTQWDWIGFEDRRRSSGVQSSGLLSANTKKCDCGASSRRNSSRRESETPSAVRRNWFDDKRYSCQPDDFDVV